jgi:transforming growth factor-beta-induced protein
MRTIAAIAVSALAAVSLYGCGGDGTTTPAPAPAPVATMNIVQLAQATPALSNLTALLVSHNLTDTLSGDGPFTVFAPTNEAFAAAADVIATLTDEQITEVLTYHVVGAKATSSDLTQGENLNTLFAPHNLTVDTLTPDVTIKPDSVDGADAKVTTADVMATNGVVHIVDAVLVPNLAGPSPPPAPATMNIVQLAQATPALSNLTALLVSHNLTDTLSGAGPFTVFAPTNDAFAAAADVIATLTDDQITQVLTYHVVGGKATSSDLTQDESLATVFSGHNLTVASLSPTVIIHPDGASAADATVTTADVMATNGVVHIVDAVLVPDLASLIKTVLMA